MTRIGVAFGIALALAACSEGSQDRAAARKAQESTEVTVESAQQPGQPAGQASEEKTQVTVESARTHEKPAEK